VVLLGAGTLIGLRFMWFYINGQGAGHIQSLILTSVLIGMGFQTLLIAVVADLLSANRQLLEDLRYNLKVLSRNDQNIDPEYQVPQKK